MASKIKVAVAGATGVTGSSIMNALLAETGKFELTALARPASIGKQALVDFKKRGVIVKAADLGGPLDALVETLVGMDVIIECMTSLNYQGQMSLVEAASKARVGRYVPSFFGTACPPRGIMPLRDGKENVLDRIKSLYLPFTVIDVGWWYQLSLPPLPSGRAKGKFEYAITEILGNGEATSALVDNRDIGRYVARIIVDQRTLNKMVFAYGEVWTQNKIWSLLEKMSGESVAREHLPHEGMLEIIGKAQKVLSSNPTDLDAMTKVGVTQYKISIGIREDNTPEHAKYLGYLDAKELYPDQEHITFESFVEQMLQGKLRAVYS